MKYIKIEKDIIYGAVAVILIFAVVFVMGYYGTKESYEYNREESGMVLIENGLVYNKKTYVVYVESLGTHLNSYTPLIDSNGCMCIYDINTNEIKSIIKDGD